MSFQREFAAIFSDDVRMSLVPVVAASELAWRGSCVEETATATAVIVSAPVIRPIKALPRVRFDDA